MLHGIEGQSDMEFSVNRAEALNSRALNISRAKGGRTSRILDLLAQGQQADQIKAQLGITQVVFASYFPRLRRQGVDTSPFIVSPAFRNKQHFAELSSARDPKQAQDILDKMSLGACIVSHRTNAPLVRPLRSFLDEHSLPWTNQPDQGKAFTRYLQENGIPARRFERGSRSDKKHPNGALIFYVTSFNAKLERLFIPTQTTTSPEIVATAGNTTTPSTEVSNAIQKAKQGDQYAYGFLVKEYERLVKIVALRIVKDTDLADEIRQDVFLEAYKNLSKVDPKKGFASWIIRLTKWRALDRIRKLGKTTQVLLELGEDVKDDSADSSPDEWTENVAQKKALQDALSRLPETQRLAILYSYAGKTHVEIAAILEEPLGTIKTRIRVGMQKMRQDQALIDLYF